MATIGMCVRSASNISKNFANAVFHRSPQVSSPRLRFYSEEAVNSQQKEKGTSDGKKVEQVDENKAKDDQAVNNLDMKLQEEKKKLEAEIKEFKDKHLRALAETENVRRRMAKQVDDMKKFGIQGFCKDLLEVADVLNKATESVPQEELTDKNPHLINLFNGLTMTEQQLQKIFRKHGLEKIDPKLGDAFDPNVHEALFQVPTPEKEKDSQIADIQKIGYRLHERTIRPALVGVFKA